MADIIMETSELSKHANSERAGQAFGKKCWEEGKTVEETLKLAAQECGFDDLPENPAKWPKFVHGAEEAWQDKNLGLD